MGGVAFRSERHVITAIYKLTIVQNVANRVDEDVQEQAHEHKSAAGTETDSEEDEEQEEQERLELEMEMEFGVMPKDVHEVPSAESDSRPIMLTTTSGHAPPRPVLGKSYRVCTAPKLMRTRQLAVRIVPPGEMTKFGFRDDVRGCQVARLTGTC